MGELDVRQSRPLNKIGCEGAGGGGLAPILKRIMQAWQTDGSYQEGQVRIQDLVKGGGQLLRPICWRSQRACV